MVDSMSTSHHRQSPLSISYVYVNKYCNINSCISLYFYPHCIHLKIAPPLFNTAIFATAEASVSLICSLWLGWQGWMKRAVFTCSWSRWEKLGQNCVSFGSNSLSFHILQPLPNCLTESLLSYLCFPVWSSCSTSLTWRNISNELGL